MQLNPRDLFLSVETSVRETMRIINDFAAQIALVVDSDERLLGTVTDGDIRRGLLQGLSLDSPVGDLMQDLRLYMFPTVMAGFGCYAK